MEETYEGQAQQPSQESWYIQDTADIGTDIAIKTEVAPEDI